MTEEPRNEEEITFDIEGFDPDDFPDKACCGLPEYLMLCGFFYPLEAVRLRAGKPARLAIRFFERDPRTFQPNLARTVSLVMPYCPFCGENITPDEA